MRNKSLEGDAAVYLGLRCYSSMAEWWDSELQPQAFTPTGLVADASILAHNSSR